MTEAIETGTDTYDLLTFGASVAGGWKLGDWLLKPGRRAGQADRLRRLLNNSDRWLALRSKCPPPLPPTPAVESVDDLAQAAVSLKESKYELAPYWPPNSGYLGESTRTHLEAGTRIDRYGYPGGTYVSPEGTPFPARALPPTYEAEKPYYVYEVTKPLRVKSGRIAPWFGQPGMGVQHELPLSVEALVELGYLKVIVR
jgi:hypothetical protein